MRSASSYANFGVNILAGPTDLFGPALTQTHDIVAGLKKGKYIENFVKNEEGVMRLQKTTWYIWGEGKRPQWLQNTGTSATFASRGAAKEAEFELVPRSPSSGLLDWRMAAQRWSYEVYDDPAAKIAEDAGGIVGWRKGRPASVMRDMGIIFFPEDVPAGMIPEEFGRTFLKEGDEWRKFEERTKDDLLLHPRKGVYEGIWYWMGFKRPFPTFE